ncbi:hypothetical protein BJ944DRAFT_187234 [Cunninghamella echinulata]|nr:hypothetical protein BJ944DRAFT_187234 [Cunninghamella echinulata]
MTRLSRFIYYILIIFFFIFILSILPSFQNEKVAKPHSLKPHQGTKYLSWFPHGEFTDQHEAFRNALRLGMEMDRTVIVPKLRLGKSLPWKPFNELAQQYTEHNDKELIREKYCKEAVNEISPITTTATTNTDDSICTTLNEWTEIAWSSLFDLKAISKEYNINIIERLEGHGWGMDESAIEIKNKILDVVIVDAQTFPENITLYDESYVQQQRLKAQIEKLNQKKKWGDLLFNKNQQLFGKSTPSSSPHLPLNNVVRPLQWEAVKNRQYLQFGALSSTPRYQTHQTKKQMAFRKSLNKYLLVSPNQLSDLTKQANKVITTLGGINTFSSLRLNFAKLISLDARINKKLLSSSASNNNNDIMVTTMDDLDPQTQKEVMDAVVLEVFGDIPINQAVSAAMPVNPSSPLADILLKHKEASSTSLSTSPIERQKLLNACLNYRADVEQKYPIYYLFNDYIDSPITRPDIYGPLLSFFPCLFTKEDMKQWGILDMITWINDNPELNDHGVDYEKLLNPILDILIAGQGYSFFEVPQTPLSRFMGWQRKGSLSDNDSL